MDDEIVRRYATLRRELSALRETFLLDVADAFPSDAWKGFPDARGLPLSMVVLLHADRRVGMGDDERLFNALSRAALPLRDEFCSVARCPGFEADLFEQDGLDPLAWAVSSRLCKAVEFLLKIGFSPSFAGPSWRSALVVAHSLRPCALRPGPPLGAILALIEAAALREELFSCLSSAVSARDDETP